MGKDSSIEWTDHTFNPWWGCSKVSSGCANCYAEAWAHRVGEKIWGEKENRRFFGEKHWSEPLKWNAVAESEKRRKRVFCASIADVFESRSDLDYWRNRLWVLVGQTPWLDWLLLTKRSQNIERLAPWTAQWPENVWIGTTVEDQEYAEQRLPILLQFPAKCRFLSCEPLPLPPTGAAAMVTGCACGSWSYKSSPMKPRCRSRCVIFRRARANGIKSSIGCFRSSHPIGVANP
jgi:protein gp37